MPQSTPSPAVVPRVTAVPSILLFSVACALTIALTRVYLVLTGYPQIGGAVFHLAHALWGGLALIIAVVLLISVSDTWVMTWGALLGGVGAGLFVDEVGKFITQENDYFFPLAATIVYLFLVALAGATLWLSRLSRTSARAHLHAALELAAYAADDHLSAARRASINAHLDRARASHPSPGQLDLIDALDRTVGFGVDNEHRQLVEDSRWERWLRSLSPDRVRKLARALLSIQVYIGLLALVLVPLALWEEFPIVPDLVNAVEVGGFGKTMTYVSYAAIVVASALALIAVIRLRPRRVQPESAIRYGMTSMVILLVVANALGSYTSQFQVLGEAIFQACTMAALLLWRELLREEASAAAAKHQMTGRS